MSEVDVAFLCFTPDTIWDVYPSDYATFLHSVHQSILPPNQSLLFPRLRCALSTTEHHRRELSLSKATIVSRLLITSSNCARIFEKLYAWDWSTSGTATAPGSLLPTKKRLRFQPCRNLLRLGSRQSMPHCKRGELERDLYE